MMATAPTTRDTGPVSESSNWLSGLHGIPPPRPPPKPPQQAVAVEVTRRPITRTSWSCGCAKARMTGAWRSLRAWAKFLRIRRAVRISGRPAVSARTRSKARQSPASRVALVPADVRANLNRLGHERARRRVHDFFNELASPVEHRAGVVGVNGRDAPDAP